MERIYKEIQGRIDRIDFDLLWPGFKQYDFAIYNQQSVCFKGHIFPVTDQFIGNTTIKYEGKQIAIWNIHDHDLNDLDLLAAAIIHEMFHAHQVTMGENRFYSDLDALSYPLVYDNLNLKANEFKVLSKAINAKDFNQMQKLFIDFMSIRKKRFALIGENYTYEKSIETVEGTAEYLMLKSLSVLNHYSFEKQLSSLESRLNTIGVNLLDTRRSAYYSGAIICLLADELNLNYKKAIVPNHDFNYDLICALLNTETQTMIDVIEYTEIQNLIVENEKSTLKCVTDIIEDNSVRIIEGDFQVKGYDPMNMNRVDQFVYHKHLLGVSQNENTEFLLGPTVIETDGKDFKKFFRYYRVSEDYIR